MAERIDNFSYAWNGASLDWDVVFGADFERMPAGSVTVFKPCSFDELIRIARQGVSPLPDAARFSPAYRELQAVDRHRPAGVARRGIRRSGAIFALPSPDLPPHLHHREFAMLEMRIDPRDAYVADADILSNSSPFGSSPFGRGRSAPHKLYWSGLVSLAEFRRTYVKIDALRGCHWAARRGAPARLPRTFFAPEVLIMAPRISQRQVRLYRRDRLADDAYAPDLVEDEWDEDLME